MFFWKTKHPLAITSYKIEYYIKINQDRLFDLLAKKDEYLNIESFTAQLLDAYQNGLMPDESDNVLNTHYFSMYVDIKSGLHIGFNHTKRVVNEEFGLNCHLINPLRKGIDHEILKSKYAIGEYSVSLHGASLRTSLLERIELCKVNFSFFERLLIRAENSQRFICRKAISSFPPNAIESLQKFNLTYTSADKIGSKPDLIQSDYVGFNEGLRFLDESIDYHEFSSEYFDFGISIHCDEPVSWIV